VNVSEYTLYMPEPVGTGKTTWILEKFYFNYKFLNKKA